MKFVCDRDRGHSIAGCANVVTGRAEKHLRRFRQIAIVVDDQHSSLGSRTAWVGPKSGWYMAGNGGNAIVMFRELHTAVVVTRTTYNTRGMHQQTIDLLQRYVLPAVPCA